MTDQEPRKTITGLAILDSHGEVKVQIGLANDPRLDAMIRDPDWRAEALERRILPVLLAETRHSAIATISDERTVILFLPAPSDTVIKFLIGVDFAYDIIDQLLTDPFNGMAVVDAKERLVYVSPIHEKFFGLREGEGVGRPVREVIENTRLHLVVRSGIAEIGQIQKMKGGERVVSRQPVRRDGKVVGAIGRVMFKGPQQVEALARRVSSLEREIETYRSEAADLRQGQEHLDAIIGNSPAIQKVRDLIRKIAPLDIPVLIRGESGTGKELVAHALHMISPRRGGRLVTVNAAALPAALVESELFGYESGAFTGADRKGRAGKFELADKGTIFLDEIGDMPLDVQSKLLRVLQDRVVERVGGDQPRKIDFRLCSATNVDLEQSVEKGQFRLDLFYRISPVIITLPSLNERAEDIPLLVRHFVQDLARQHGRALPEVDDLALDYLCERSWPGNIRELRHLLERAIVLNDSGRLSADDFGSLPSQSSAAPGSEASRLAALSRPAAGGRLKEALDAIERDIMREAMEKFKGNKKRVADHLGVSRSYLYKKLGE